MNRTAFAERLLRLLRYPLIMFDASTHVDLCLLFVAKFLIKNEMNDDARQENQEEGDESQQNSASLLLTVMNALIQVCMLHKSHF